MWDPFVTVSLYVSQFFLGQMQYIGGRMTSFAIYLFFCTIMSAIVIVMSRLNFLASHVFTHDNDGGTKSALRFSPQVSTCVRKVSGHVREILDSLARYDGSMGCADACQLQTLLESVVHALDEFRDPCCSRCRRYYSACSRRHDDNDDEGLPRDHSKVGPGHVRTFPLVSDVVCLIPVYRSVCDAFLFLQLNLMTLNDVLTDLPLYHANMELVIFRNVFIENLYINTRIYGSYIHITEIMFPWNFILMSWSRK